MTIDELIAGVDIALGIAPVSGCRAADLSGEGRVGIDELVRAVQAALMACPPTPTRTETVPSTPTPTTSPTSTATAVPSNTPTDTATPLLPTSTPSHTATASPTPTAVPVTHTPVAPTPIPTATPTLQAVPPGNVELTIAPVVPDDPDSPTGFFAVQLGGGNRASAVEGGPLRLLAGLRDADGIAPLSLMDDVVFAVPTAIATYCFRLVAAGSSGYIDCDGGSGVDVVRESNPGATPGDIILFVGGNDSGPGAAVLFIETQEVATLPTGAPTGACATASYAAPLPARYTTGLASELHEGLERRRGVNFACDFSGGGLGAGALVGPLALYDETVRSISGVLRLAVTTHTEPSDPPATALPTHANDQPSCHSRAGGNPVVSTGSVCLMDPRLRGDDATRNCWAKPPSTATLQSVAPAAGPTASRIVALSGGAAPGTEPGVFFSSFSLPEPDDGPTINASGDVVFRAALEGPGVAFDGDEAGIWMGRSAARLAPVVRGRDVVPGSDGGLRFAPDFGRPVLADARQVAFRAALSPTGSADGGIPSVWLATGNPPLAELARAGALAPGTEPETRFSDFGAPAVDASGRVTFVADVQGPEIDSNNATGLWSGSSPVVNIVRAGDAAPGVQPGAQFLRFGSVGAPSVAPAVGADGRRALLAELQPGQELLPPATGIWLAAATSIEKVVAGGDAAVELPLTTFEELEVHDARSVTIDRAGRIAFRARLSNGEASLWRSDAAGGRELIAAGGQPAAGFADGTTFGGGVQTFSNPSINAAGTVAFRGSVQGVDLPRGGVGVWLGSPGAALRDVARGGDTAPGGPAGIVFGDQEFDFGAPAVNGLGQVAFIASLYSRQSGFSLGESLFAFDPTVGLMPLVSRDDVIEVAAGDLRFVSSLAFAPGSAEDGRGAGLNDRGELGFFVGFTDGSSAVVVARVGALLCPGDCDADGAVGIDELVAGVGMAIANQGTAACAAFDRNADDAASVDELIAGVEAALHGCP